MRIAGIGLFIAMLLAATAQSHIRGNLNLNYQGRDSGAGEPQTYSFGQILNIYTSDRLFYSNEMTLGAFVFRNKLSTRQRSDFRIRYSFNLNGYRYSLYSSYSPYTVYLFGDVPEKIRVFQGSLTYTPKLLPDVTASYASNRQYTTDQPRSRSGFSYTWNVGSQLSKSFGNFRAVYQRQQLRSDRPITIKQIQKNINLGYDIGKRLPGRIAWSTSYNFTDNRAVAPGRSSENSRTHNGAMQFSRVFGRWFSASAGSSGRTTDFNRASSHTRVDDLFSSATANLNLRRNLSLVLTRGYSLNRVDNDTTSRTENDYMNLGAAYVLGLAHGADARFAVSKSIFYKSSLGRNETDNASMILDMELYHQTNLTANLGFSRNNKTYSEYGRYQMNRSIYVVTRPYSRLQLDINYQSSLVSRNINFINSNNTNLSVNANQTLKPNFNYTITYTRNRFKAGNVNNVVWSVAAAINYRISETLSMLTAYSRRDLGKILGIEEVRIDESISERVSWALTRRSNLTANYTVSNLNTARQSQSYGGYFVLSF